MKAQKKKTGHVEKILQGEGLVGRFMLAADRVPGTEFDRQIFAADMFDPASDGDEEARALNNTWRSFEKKMRMSIRRRDSQLFRDFADAIDKYRKHMKTRAPDKKRMEILYFFFTRSRENVTAKKIGEHLRERNLAVPGEDVEHFVRFACKQLGVPLKPDRVGRPPKNTDKIAVKESR